MPDHDRRIADLERNLRAIPSRFAGGGASVFYVIVMGSGNLLATYGTLNYYGAANPLTSPYVVPTTAPSLTPGACPSGLSWGQLYGPNGTQATVWVATRARPEGLGTDQQDLSTVVTQNTTVVAFRSVPMQVAATGVYVPVYLTGRIA